MKTIHWLGGLAALTLAAAAGGATLAQAQTPSPGPQRAGPPPGGERGPRGGGEFGRFRPTPEEMKQLRAQRFARIDANHDGKVTFEEFRAYQEARKLERQHRMFSRLTGGKDSLTLAELNERADARMHGRGGRMGRGGGRFGPGGPGGDDHVR